MIFHRLIWAALGMALLVGSVQTGVQRWQAAPLILAAEDFEEQKALAPEVHELVEAPAHATMASGHTHEHEHEHGAAAGWEPQNGAERTAWTWVANVLHAFSMALLMLVVMGIWQLKRGSALGSRALAGAVAAAGWLSFDLWPTLGLPAEVPGMQAASLHARQLWWLLAVGSACSACAVAGFARARWRWGVAALLLAVPFLVGAPQLQGDALAGYDATAHAALAQLADQFVWATTWVSLSFWISLGLVVAPAFQRWLRPVLTDVSGRSSTRLTEEMGAPQ
jgi:cobalt transporter subunit CbtA